MDCKIGSFENLIQNRPEVFVKPVGFRIENKVLVRYGEKTFIILFFPFL